jgi:copper oxidase (laccase) domain-containing protein
MIHHGKYLEFAPFQAIGWLRHCFTTKSFMRDDAMRMEACLELKGRYFSSAHAMVWGEQIHGAGIATVVDATPGVMLELPGIDAIICGTPGICLVAFGADCPIVYVADAKKRVIALVHSGRRGSEKRIVTTCVERMAREFGTSPADCTVAISPSIGPCCYPVDLWAGIEKELRRLGIDNVNNPRLCTSCHSELFFSYRREKGRCGRMLAGMMVTTA